MAQKRVKPGDCFDSIAASNKFFNYQTVYGYDDNAAQHPHPNQLVEGSVVKIPDKVQKTVNLILDATTVLVVVQRKTKLRIVVKGFNGSALPQATYSLAVSYANTSSAPDPQGVMQLPDIDPKETSGTLKIQFAAPPAPAALAPDPPAQNPPANPPLILPSEYRDVAPKSSTELLQVAWDLEVGALEPSQTIRGTLQRLNNLSFPDVIRKDENDKTRRIVKGYQASQGTPAAARTGNVADISAQLG